MSWERASQHCKNQGARLCTVDELEDNCAMYACGRSEPNIINVAWTSNNVIAERKPPPMLKEPLPVVGSTAKYCYAIGDPHYYAPWRRLLNRFDDDTKGELDFFRIRGLKIIVEQGLAAHHHKATVHKVRIEYDERFIATISVSNVDIPEPMVYSPFTISQWPSSRTSFKYQITFPAFPDVVFGWRHWITTTWGAQLGIGVRYSGNWNLVGGQCGNPDDIAASDCDDCNVGHPEEMNKNPPTCETLQTCCSFFDNDDFMKAACLIDHFELCCEDDSDETCCDDMKV